jgi:hypothetical protein
MKDIINTEIERDFKSNLYFEWGQYTLGDGWKYGEGDGYKNLNINLDVDVCNYGSVCRFGNGFMYGDGNGSSKTI